MLHSHFVLAVLNEVLEVLGVNCITFDCMDYYNVDGIHYTDFTKRFMNNYLHWMVRNEALSLISFTLSEQHGFSVSTLS